jgi:hypothetical protein
MRKLELKHYTVSIRDTQGKLNDIPYDFKDAIINLMFHPDLRLSGTELLKTNILTEKIMEADEEIILEEEEYNKVKNAVDSFQGFTRNEVELVKRVTECPKIDVKEK